MSQEKTSSKVKGAIFVRFPDNNKYRDTDIVEFRMIQGSPVSVYSTEILANKIVAVQEFLKDNDGFNGHVIEEPTNLPIDPKDCEIVVFPVSGNHDDILFSKKETFDHIKPEGHESDELFPIENVADNPLNYILLHQKYNKETKKFEIVFLCSETAKNRQGSDEDFSNNPPFVRVEATEEEAIGLKDTLEAAIMLDNMILGPEGKA